MGTTSVRMATPLDISAIMHFIKEQWGENHILANDREFFKYQHLFDDHVTFILGEEDDKLCGLLGYIQYSNETRPDIAGALWKVAQSSHPLFGMELFEFMLKETHAREYIGPGANPKTTVAIHRFMGYQTGKLNHYYRLADKASYQVAVVNNKIIAPISDHGAPLDLISTADELKKKFDTKHWKDRLPYKSFAYLEYRYFNHPVYQYQVYGIGGNHHSEQYHSILVAREQEQNGAKVLRIVDFIGVDHELSTIAFAIQQLMVVHQYEYVDFYAYGLSDELLLKTGFIKKDEKDENIIPNYFEPFVCQNVDIWFTATATDDNFYCFKGDADQDRPNFWNKGDQ